MFKRSSTDISTTAEATFKSYTMQYRKNFLTPSTMILNDAISVNFYLIYLIKSFKNDK